jgi:NADH dehydrogenase
MLDGNPKSRPFRYFDKGNMAVVGKNFAILESGRIRLTGFLTFWLSALVHVMSLPQLQNRRQVWAQWLWTYFTGQRAARLIPEGPPSG